MSTLTQNLQTIYGIKQEIKEAIGTNSDIFADYPAYISAMAGGITPTGYAYVTSNGDYDVSSYAMVNVEVSGPVKGVSSHVFVSISPGLTGYSNYPYFSASEMQYGAEQSVDNYYLVPFTDTYDDSVQVHTLISDAFTTWGIDPNDFVSSIKVFTAYDWNSGDPTYLQDLTCTTMLQEANSNYECWCIVEGTLQNATDVCFKAETGIWDSMQTDWDMQQDEALLECMPVVEKYQDPYSPYGWSTNYDYNGTYISLPARPVRLYFHYMEGDGSMCDVYYGVYDDLNSQWSAKWYSMIETGVMTFVNPNANE